MSDLLWDQVEAWNLTENVVRCEGLEGEGPHEFPSAFSEFHQNCTKVILHDSPSGAWYKLIRFARNDNVKKTN